MMFFGGKEEFLDKPWVKWTMAAALVVVVILVVFLVLQVSGTFTLFVPVTGSSLAGVMPFRERFELPKNLFKRGL
jgi:hypothetical protein